MNITNDRSLAAGIIVVAATALLSGCASVIQTLDRGTQAMVKMPVPVEPGFGKQRHANGIVFQQAFAAPTMGERRPATWFLAWREDKTPVLKNRLHGMEDIARAAHDRWKQYPILIEENFTFKATGRRWGPPETETGVRKEGLGECLVCEGGGRTAQAVKSPSKVWPYRLSEADKANWQKRHPGESVPDFDPLWHLGDDYTQLRSARQEARLKPGANPIKIGHLDNGFTAGHLGAAANMFRDSSTANCTGLDSVVTSGEIKDRLKDHPQPGETHGTHGTGSLGILAGGPVRMAPTKLRGVRIGGINEAIGGAPEAKVLSVRVAPWVGSLSSGEMAYGIDLASRIHGCDVISMSHGGLPTVAWADAINAAYERGTAIFAAESDFFSLVPRPFYPNPFIWPSSPVWPAAFRRVVGVTGVQKDGVTYAKNGGLPLTGFMRGSYGPDGARNFGIFSNHAGDSQTVRFGGTLRAQPIAAYAPNIVWPEVREDKKTGKRYLDGLAFDGGGTSSATPQVAAAAALWLQKHRKNFTDAEWNSWKRPEAVYYALIKSAQRKDGTMKPDKYLGAGILKAKDALAITPQAAMSATKSDSDKEKVVDLCYPKDIRGTHPPKDYGMTMDFADGERSFKAFVGWTNPSKVRVEDRKNLQSKVKSGESFAEAMKRIRDNDELIRQWRSGHIPKK